MVTFWQLWKLSDFCYFIRNPINLLHFSWFCIKNKLFSALRWTETWNLASNTCWQLLVICARIAGVICGVEVFALLAPRVNNTRFALAISTPANKLKPKPWRTGGFHFPLFQRRVHSLPATWPACEYRRHAGRIPKRKLRVSHICSPLENVGPWNTK